MSPARRLARSFSPSARTRSRDRRAKSPALAAGGLQSVPVGRPVRVLGMEAEKPQDAQVVLADAGWRVADEADPPGGEIREAVRVVVEGPVGAERERVDGEVAALGVGREVAAEAHDGVTAVRLDILAQGRDLEGLAVDHHRDGAVLDAGRDGLEAGVLRRGG